MCVLALSEHRAYDHIKFVLCYCVMMMGNMQRMATLLVSVM